MRINRKHSVYYVEVDTKPYKVGVGVWRDPRSKEIRVDWSVSGSQGIHTYARHCDPNGATFKRVVAAMRAALPASEFALDLLEPVS
jgi:hypothetical protein